MIHSPNLADDTPIRSLAVWTTMLAVSVPFTLGLSGCGAAANEPPRPTPTETRGTSAPASHPPVSELVPGLTLPTGSVDEAADGYPEMELWKPPVPYDATVRHLRDQLPIGKDYKGLAWCTEDVNQKIGTTVWSWGDAKELLVVSVSSDPTVTIIRGPDELEDRAGCDVPAPGGQAPYSRLAEISLPPGTAAVEIGTPDPTVENWSLPGTHADAERYLRDRLPIGQSHLGLPWCAEDPGDEEYVDWTWGTEAELLTVHLLGGLLTIERAPNSYGCIE